MSPCYLRIGAGIYQGLRRIEFEPNALSSINKLYSEITSKELIAKKEREVSVQKELDEKEVERIKQREEREKIVEGKKESALKKISASLEDKPVSSYSTDDQQEIIRRMSQENALMKGRVNEFQRLLVANERERLKEEQERKREEAKRVIDNALALSQIINGPTLQKFQKEELKTAEAKILQSQKALSNGNSKTALEMAKQYSNTLKEIDQKAFEDARKDTSRKYGVSGLVKALNYIGGWDNISVQSVDKTDPKGVVIITAKHISGATVTMEYNLDGNLKIKFSGIADEDQAHSEQDALVEAIQSYGIRITKTKLTGVQSQVARKPITRKDNENKGLKYYS